MTNWNYTVKQTGHTRMEDNNKPSKFNVKYITFTQAQFPWTYSFK